MVKQKMVKIECTIESRKEIDMNWSYNRDENLLSDKAVGEAIETFLRFNSLMAFASEDCGSKKDMACAAALKCASRKSMLNWIVQLK